MSPSSSLADALTKLSEAVDALEKKIETRVGQDRSVLDADAEVQRMGADRTRLAEALDGATERHQQLDHVNREVSRRLVDVMEVVRNVIEQQKRA